MHASIFYVIAVCSVVVVVVVAALLLMLFPMELLKMMFVLLETYYLDIIIDFFLNLRYCG